MELHYFFPPARAYPLNRCLYRIKTDDAVRERFRTDFEGLMDELGLDGEARAALRAMDRDRLVACGAHPYLVFIAELRLRIDRQPAEFERF